MCVLSDEVDLFFVLFKVSLRQSGLQSSPGYKWREVGNRTGGMDKRRKQGWLDTRIVR